MPQDNRAVEDEVADAPSLPIVHVAAADSRLLYVHPDIMLIPKLGDLTVLERDVLDGLEYECGVLKSLAEGTSGVRGDTNHLGHFEIVLRVTTLMRYCVLGRPWRWVDLVRRVH